MNVCFVMFLFTEYLHVFFLLLELTHEIGTFSQFFKNSIKHTVIQTCKEKSSKMLLQNCSSLGMGRGGGVRELH